MSDSRNRKVPGGEPLPWRRRVILIGLLLAVIIAALIGHIIFRPDRNASLTIIYTGDMQGQISYVAGQYAGYEKIASLAAQAERDGHQLLLLDAGNCLGGSENAEIDDGRSMVQLMNEAGYDAMVPGPADFVYGADALSSLRAETKFPFLAANILKSDGSQVFENYRIININNVRIGLIGVTAGIGQAQADRWGLTIADPVETVQNVISQIQGKTDTVIVLAYTGNEAVSRALAEIDAVSIVIESGSDEAYSSVMEDGTVIACAGSKGSVVGVASLEITRGSAVVDNYLYHAEDYDGVEADADMLQAITELEQSRSNAEAMQIGTVTLAADSLEEGQDMAGETSVDDSFTDEGDETNVNETDVNETDAGETDGDAANLSVSNHTYETAIGNLTADAMLDAASSDGASLALIWDRSINGTLISGSVSRGQVGALFDDNLYLVTCKMTGGEIRTVLENSFNGYPNASDFMQVAGITYAYNASTDIGTHLSNIAVAGHSLDDARTYVVAMTNTMADELGYTSENLGRIGSYRTLTSVVCSYIEKQSAADVAVKESETAESGAAEDGNEAASGTPESETEESRRILIVN